MMDIIITDRSGKIFRASETCTVKERWQKETSDMFLAKFMSANYTITFKDVGMEDEPKKILKDETGKQIWEEGNTVCMYDGVTFSVTGTPIPVEIPAYDPLADLTSIQKAEVERRCQFYFEQGREERH